MRLRRGANAQRRSVSRADELRKAGWCCGESARERAVPSSTPFGTRRDARRPAPAGAPRPCRPRCIRAAAERSTTWRFSCGRWWRGERGASDARRWNRCETMPNGCPPRAKPPCAPRHPDGGARSRARWRTGECSPREALSRGGSVAYRCSRRASSHSVGAAGERSRSCAMRGSCARSPRRSSHRGVACDAGSRRWCSLMWRA